MFLIYIFLIKNCAINFFLFIFGGCYYKSTTSDLFLLPTSTITKPPNLFPETSQPTYRLLSSSLDKTLIIWEPSASAEQRGVWVERVRVGEVGGNGLGFYGARFGPAARKFVGHGYNGSFHVWTLDEVCWSL